MDDMVVVGKVRRAWGVKGELIVDWFDGSCPVKLNKDMIFVKKEGSSVAEKFFVTKSRKHGTGFVIALNGMASINDVESFRGSDIWIEKSTLPELKEGEYFTYQLIDIEVKTTEGKVLGKIIKIFPTGSNDVYVVWDGTKEILIPAITDVVKEVDLDNGVMVVELIEGLE